jgi:hypothetical protein
VETTRLVEVAHPSERVHAHPILVLQLVDSLKLRDQYRPVVDQALALKDSHNLARKPETVGDEAATSSVGEVIALRTNATTHRRPMTAYATAATVTIVSSTRPTTCNTTGLRFALRSCGEEKKAAE